MKEGLWQIEVVSLAGFCWGYIEGGQALLAQLVKIIKISLGEA